jgi:hypothetical protein
LKYRGRNGITSVKPVNPIKLAAVTAKRFRRQCGSRSCSIGVFPCFSVAQNLTLTVLVCST